MVEDKERLNSIKFEDGEVLDEELYDGFTYQKGVTIKEIIMNHIQKMSSFILRDSLEPGIKENQSGLTRKEQDKREIFIQAIEFMEKIFAPHFDKEMLEVMEQFKKRLTSLKENINDLFMRKEALIQAKRSGAMDTTSVFNEWYNIYKEAKVSLLNRDSIEWEEYLNERYSLYMGLFGEMNHCLFRRDYLANEAYTE